MNLKEFARLSGAAVAITLGGAAKAEDVSFPPVGYSSFAALPTAIPGVLTYPPSGTPPFPAVVIAHGSGGLRKWGPEQHFAMALNENGIATLVIDMWAARGIPTGAEAIGGKGGPDRRPYSPTDTMPDAFGALQFLSNSRDIDPDRIGILGFSWGAAMSLLAATEYAVSLATKTNVRFAAHSAHYLVCWPFSGPAAPMSNLIAGRWTGRPIQLHVAGRDDYDGADGGSTCRAFLTSLPEEKKASVKLVLHANAAHGWDFTLPEPISVFDRYSNKGLGGTVRIEPDPVVAAEAREKTVAFFIRAFRR